MDELSAWSVAPADDGPRTEPGPIEAWRQWWAAQGLDGSPEAELARGQGYVASLTQLAAVGFDRYDDRRELRRGTWTAFGRGLRSPVRVDGGDNDRHVVARRRHALVATGAALVRVDQVISGRSAAVLRGLPTFRLPELPELTARDATLGRRASTHVFGAALTARDVDDWFGAPATTVARTIVDLARHERWDGIMACDAALHEELVTAAELDRALASARGWPGIRQAREIVSLSDARAESPLESLTRLRLHDDGFPPVVPQFVVPDPARGRSYRVDLLLPEARLIIEADGRGKYRDDAMWREKKRETRLRALGYRVERVIWDDIVRSWPLTSRRLWALLAA